MLFREKPKEEQESPTEQTSYRPPPFSHTIMLSFHCKTRLCVLNISIQS